MPMRSLRSILEHQDLVHVPPDRTVRDAARLMAERNVAAILIIDGGGLQGIFTERDLLQRVVAKGLDPAGTAIREVMTPDVFVLDADASGFEAVRMMRDRGVRHVVVVGLGGVGYAVASIRDFLSREIVSYDREIEFEKRVWEEL